MGNNMDRKKRLTRLLSQAAEGKKVKEEGIGSFDPDPCYGLCLGTTYFT